jgi:hypothetical protein
VKLKDPEYLIVSKKTGEVAGDYVPRKPRRSGHKYLLVFSVNIGKANMIIRPVEYLILSEMNSLNIIDLSRSARAFICSEKKISESQLYNTYSTMIKKDLLLRINAGKFMANPLYVTKSNKNKTLELQGHYYRLKSELSKHVKKRKPRKQLKHKPLQVVNLYQLNDEDYPL